VSSSLPTASVLVPCYNAEPYLRQALDSVAAQTCAPLECIVVDDGSTDGSGDIAASYGPPFRVIRQANQGRAAAMNRAIEEARGDAVLFLDADDFWLPEMIEAQIGTLASSDAAMVYCRAIRCDERGIDLPERVAEPLSSDCLRELLFSNQLNGCGACVRTEVLRAVGGFDGRFWPADDYHLWLRIAARHRIAFQPQPLGRYRWYPQQASGARVRMQLVALAAKLDFLRSHPEVERRLGDAHIRQAVEEPFFETLRRYCTARVQPAARRLARCYLRHWPTRGRAWWYAAMTHSPWRLFARWAEGLECKKGAEAQRTATKHLGCTVSSAHRNP
jgi:glycosyltransferase involved in cell wall biosynthesis